MRGFVLRVQASGRQDLLRASTLAISASRLPTPRFYRQAWLGRRPGRKSPTTCAASIQPKSVTRLVPVRCGRSSRRNTANGRRRTNGVARRPLAGSSPFTVGCSIRGSPSCAAWDVEKIRSARLKAGRQPGDRQPRHRRAYAVLSRRPSSGSSCRRTRWPPSGTRKSIRSPRVRYLSPDEERRLRAALEARETRRRRERQRFNAWRRRRGYKTFPEYATFTDHLKPMILLALNTGMRRGELFNLAWRDVDLGRRMLTVVGRTAKSAQTRHIPLNDEAHAVLSRWGGAQRPRGAGLPGTKWAPADHDQDGLAPTDEGCPRGGLPLP